MRQQSKLVRSSFSRRRALRLAGAFIIVLSLMILVPPPRPVHAAGNIWTVNDAGDSGITTCNAGAGASGPTCQLRDAINKAGTGDTINFGISGLGSAQTITLSGL